MARYRSRRKSALRRVVLPTCAVGFVLFVGYLLLPDGRPEAAKASGPAIRPAGANAGHELAEPAAKLEAEKKPPTERAPATRPFSPASRPAPERKLQPIHARDPAQGPARAEAEPAAGNLDAPTDAPASRPASFTTPASTFLNEAASLAEAGKLLEARAKLNEALQSGRLDHATAEAVKTRIRELNQTIIFAPSRRFPDDPQHSEYTVQPGDNLVKICRNLAVPHGFIARVNAVNPNRIREGQSLKLIQGPIHGVVNKKHFTMDLYLGALPGQPGSMYLTTYRVGLGEGGGTPTGLWEVSKNSKTVNPAWANPRTEERFTPDDPKNPLGEHWIGLTGIAGEAVGAVSYGIHGTIEPQTIGTNASMGCIRLKAQDVAQVFDMLSEGRSTVLVVEE